MKKFIAFALCCALLLPAIAIGAEATQHLQIRGWDFEVPAGLKKEIRDGVDFTVTYLTSPDSTTVIVIYEGMHPQHLAEGRAGVTKEKAEIGGQSVEWSVWDFDAEGSKKFYAETYIVINPGSLPEELFHVFLFAPSQDDLRSLQSQIAKAHK